MHHAVDAGRAPEVRLAEDRPRPTNTPSPTVSHHQTHPARSAFDMHCGHPSNEVRQRLALQLHMSPKSVQVWFQNRRQKLRGQQQQLGGHPAMTLKPSQRAGVAPLSVGPSPTSSQDSMDWSPTQQMVADAERREAMQPFPPQAACVTPLSPQHNAPVYDLAAAAATPMHPSHAYALPRPEAFQTSLPAHILNELASVSSAEQDLANFARQLMQRKVDLLDNIRRIEQQAAAARQAHMVGVPSYPPAAQAPPQVYYKKEMPEPYRVRRRSHPTIPTHSPIGHRPDAALCTA